MPNKQHASDPLEAVNAAMTFPLGSIRFNLPREFEEIFAHTVCRAAENQRDNDLKIIEELCDIIWCFLCSTEPNPVIPIEAKIHLNQVRERAKTHFPKRS